MDFIIKVRKISQWLVAIGVFLPNFLELPLLFLSVLIISFKREKWYASKIIVYLIIIFSCSITTICILGYDFNKAVQQIFFLSLFVLLYEQFFIHYKNDIVSIFRKYIIVSYYICFLGLVQEFIYCLANINIMHILPGYYADHYIFGGLLRVTSTLCEGGWLGTSVIPALVYLFYYNDKFCILGKKRFVVLLASILTVSPFVYCFFFILIVLKLKGKLRFVKKFAKLVSVATVAYVGLLIVNHEYDEKDTGLNNILIRLHDTYKIITNMNENDLNTLLSYSGNTSTSVIAINMYIGFHAPSRLLGTGIGTNAQSYKKIVDVEDSLELNLDDGYSLFNRILSEFGILGISLYVLCIFKFYNRKNSLNICFLCMIACLFCRGGNYMFYGTVFVHFLYYYTSKFNLDLKDATNYYYSNIQCGSTNEYNIEGKT